MICWLPNVLTKLRKKHYGAIILPPSPSSYANDDCSTRGGEGESFMLLSNLLDTNGEDVGGGIPSHGMDFLEIRVLHKVWCALSSN